MSKNIKWTQVLRAQMYTAVIKVMGHPVDVPRNGRGKPIGLSQADYIDTLDSIGVMLGCGSGKGGALSNQIAWVYCTPSKGCHQGHWNNMGKNLAAADIAGYFNKVSPTAPSVVMVPVPVSPSPVEASVVTRVWGTVKGWFS
jgi:hypothetical protein